MEFSNEIGYIGLCLGVVLSGIATEAITYLKNRKYSSDHEVNFEDDNINDIQSLWNRVQEKPNDKSL